MRYDLEDYDWIWIVIAVLLALLLALLFSTSFSGVTIAQSPGSSYVHGFCEVDEEMLANVTVYIDRQVQFAGAGRQWQTYPRSTTTNISGWWGISVPLEGVTRLRLRPVAPLGYRLVGARIPCCGYQARYVQGVGIELPPPGGKSAGNFGLLFGRDIEPTATPTVRPTMTPSPTIRPTMTPIPGPTEWIEPPEEWEDAVIQESLDLASNWVASHSALRRHAWNCGLGPWPCYGPFEVSYGDVTLLVMMYPGGNLVWCDAEYPDRIRISNVAPYSW